MIRYVSLVVMSNCLVISIISFALPFSKEGEGGQNNQSKTLLIPHGMCHSITNQIVRLGVICLILPRVFVVQRFGAPWQPSASRTVSKTCNISPPFCFDLISPPHRRFLEWRPHDYLGQRLGRRISACRT